jgi:Rrf2 family protein
MYSNNRFGVAVHVLALAKVAMEEASGVGITSERMAESVRAHPVHVRRVLGALREAGLVTSQPGPGGGWRLTRPPEAITLRDIYRAVEHEPLFGVPKQPSEDCPISQCIPGVLATCFREAEEALEERLGRVTIADVVEAVHCAVDRAGFSPQEASVASQI